MLSFVVFSPCLLALRASTASVLLKVKTFATNSLSSLNWTKTTDDSSTITLYDNQIEFKLLFS